MAERFAEIGTVLAALGMTGTETKFGNRTREQQERSYSTRMCYEIADAIMDGETDAVKVVRCKNCFWRIAAKGCKDPICSCPEKTAHPVKDDGYCNFGKPRGGM